MSRSIYNSRTHGPIPLSFTGRRLMQNLREAVTNAICKGQFGVDNFLLSQARGELAQYMSQLENRRGIDRSDEPHPYGKVEPHAFGCHKVDCNSECLYGEATPPSWADPKADFWFANKSGPFAYNFPPPYGAPELPAPPMRKAVCGDIYIGLYGCIDTTSSVQHFLTSADYRPSAFGWKRSTYAKRWTA